MQSWLSDCQGSEWLWTKSSLSHRQGRHFKCAVCLRIANEIAAKNSETSNNITFYKKQCTSVLEIIGSKFKVIFSWSNKTNTFLSAFTHLCLKVHLWKLTNCQHKNKLINGFKEGNAESSCDLLLNWPSPHLPFRWVLFGTWLGW